MTDAYDGLGYSQAELTDVMRATYDELIEVAASAPFKSLMDELGALPAPERPDFVLRVILDESQREERGLVLPDGVLVQRSAFGARRPTLSVTCQTARRKASFTSFSP